MFRQIAVTFGLVATVLAQSTPMINTPPALVECQPAQLSWSGGQSPWYISVLPGGQTSATPLEQFPVTSATSYTWTVNIASGTSITLQIRDSSGVINYSQAVTIQAGTDSSCVGVTASVTTDAAATTTGQPAETTAAAPAAGLIPTGLYAASASGYSAFPSASYSLLGSSGAEASYAVVETFFAFPGQPSAASGVLINGPSAYVLSIDGGSASLADVYASCSVSGSSAVCVESAGNVQTTFTAAFAQETGLAKRVLKIARDY